ncbi:MAG TPA: M20/M25/M40 family metallo-hydrolase, partial [Puia sp.]|nr:M20/M25/M40 family metallo-hydrolase [Puia sp.]
MLSPKPGITCLIAALLITWLCIYLDTTPTHASPPAADSVFSGPRAMAHLREIAKLPHSTGTQANRAVRDYLVRTCAAMGLDTSIQHATGLAAQFEGVASANIYNVIARIKGAANTKAVLVAAHYDSQPNAGGAGDDGSGCVAMLETARSLKAGHPLKNDIIFLFTDDEEDGLIGAHAFVRENPLVKDIGVMLNFDARGSSGVNLISETNPGNGWVIDGYARSGAHRNASSLNYEVYKRLPNSTDYTPFKAAGIAGLNNAFIGGFVNYHAMTDLPANIDPHTIQETGDNMLAEARYFGDQNITETNAPDLTFFNLIGDWFIRYPASLNPVFLLLVNILLIVALSIGVASKQVRFPGLVSGLLAFPVTLIILYFLSDFVLRGIRVASPLYGGYYSNTYHPGFYYLSLAALGIAVFALLYQWLLSRFSMPSLLMGTLIILVLATDGLYVIMPTAIYFLCFPLLVLLAGGCFTFFRRSASASQPFRASNGYVSSTAARHSATSPYIILALLLPAILLLTPIFSMFFVAFDL